MKEKYNVGKTTGRKVDPYSAAEEMRNSGKFKRAEFLSGQQISSFFSRLCQNEKKTSAEDYEAAELEDTKQNIKLTAQSLFMWTDAKIPVQVLNTVNSRYLEVKGTLWNTSRYPYFDISDLQNWGKYQLNNQISQMNI